MAPRPEVTRLVRNQSSRNGAKPKLIVVHTTEGHDRPGLEDLRGLGSWFDNPGAQASSHVGNDKDGNDARYVADERKAWTQGSFNPVSLSIEQIGFARFGRKDWLENRRKQLDNTAAWVAYWSKKYGIPIRRGQTAGCGVVKTGVVSHDQLGCGNHHTDPGKGYPFDYVLEKARSIRVPQTKESRLRAELQRLRSKATSDKWWTQHRWAARRAHAIKKYLRRLAQRRKK